MCRRVILGMVVATSLLAGCEGDNTPDSNVQVFQTPQEIAGLRQAQQEKIWTETAVEVLKVDRPDVAATPGTEFSVNLEADGVRQRVDLSPVWDQLVAQPDRSTQTLRDHLLRELPGFDRQRLLSMSPSTARERVRPMLVNGREAQEFSLQWGESGAVPSHPIAPDLYWVTAVQWPSGATTPVSTKALSTWGTDPKELDAAALQNLKKALSRPAEELFETAPFGPAGRVGSLKPDAAALVLLPEFLTKVRQAWQTEGDLAVLPGSRQSIRFVESRNTRLLDALYPAWKEQADVRPDALGKRVLLLAEKGLGVHGTYNPPVKIDVATTQPIPGMGMPGVAMPGGIGPATRPMMMPTTRPVMPPRPGMPGTPGRPYIAR